jgi:putative flavoprotein involved in K+ transport
VHRTDTLIIGAGQAGLALSHELTTHGRDHVVVERGRVGERWHSERWDSLRLLTPNWMTRLPGWAYRGPDPDGFMHRTEVADFFRAYACSFAAPVHGGTTVERVERIAGAYRVTTDQGTWLARDVVIATGAADRPHVPAVGAALDAGIDQVTPPQYRNPDLLAPGGVLVVGASATGVQLADELARAGRHVVLATGAHTRGLRSYRGRDLFVWLTETGKVDMPRTALADPDAGPREPSLQLVGGRGDDRIDLAALHARGVVVAGRLIGGTGTRVHFAEDLRSTTAAADERLLRLLDDIDDHIARRGLAAPARRPLPRTSTLPRGPRTMDLRAAGITTVLWATGYRRDYSWLHVPVLDARGELIQRDGVTPAPGLYVLGLRFQSRRNSNFIEGVGRDAAALATRIAGAPAPRLLRAG